MTHCCRSWEELQLHIHIMGHGRPGAMGYTDPGSSVVRNVSMRSLYQVLLSSCLPVFDPQSPTGSNTEWVYSKGALRPTAVGTGPSCPSGTANAAPGECADQYASGIIPLLRSSAARTDLKTIFFNGCNTAESIAEHREGASLLMRSGHTRFLVVGAVIEVDWANGTPATTWVLSTLLLHSGRDQAYRFQHLTGMLQGVGMAYHSEPSRRPFEELPLDSRPRRLPPVYAVFLPINAACSLTYNCGHINQDAMCDDGLLRNICAACAPPSAASNRKRKSSGKRKLP